MLASGKSAPRVALVHDWITTFRGGERVLHQLVDIFPSAHLYTLIHIPKTSSDAIDSLKPISSLLGGPIVRHHYRRLAPFFAPSVVQNFRLLDYDLVISSSHSFAKGVTVKPGVPHVCYCLTPIRYVWGQEGAYFGNSTFRETSHPRKITKVIASSGYIAERIKRAWERESTIVYPGVDLERFHFAPRRRENFFLLVGGFVPYKAEGLAIEAFNRLKLPLVVAGDGPSRKKIQLRARDNIRFVGRISDAELGELYSTCRALIYPQEEDFGMIAVEAQGAGAPVIALGRGGALETVIPAGQNEPTGVFFREPTVESLIEAINEFVRISSSFDSGTISKNAQRFSPEQFKTNIEKFVEPLIDSPNR